MSQLLDPSEPAAVGVERPEATSRLLLTCEHAGNRIPRALGTLGVASTELDRHIGWDIGALAVAQGISQTLDATLVFQRYSRLVIDCNRRPQDPGSIVTLADGTQVPGNQRLSEHDRNLRIEEILRSYHDAIEKHLGLREARHGSAVLISVHSFTPALRARQESRPWHIGVLAGRDRRLPDAMIRLLRAETEFCIGDNQPYGVGLTNDYTIPIHGDERGVPHVEFEIRQDLIASRHDQRQMADLLAEMIPRAVDSAGIA